MLLSLILAWTSFKPGFVRHDWHDIQYFALIACVYPVFEWTRGRRIFGVAGFAAILTAYFLVSGQRLDRTFNPTTRTADAVRAFANAASPARVRHLLARGKANIRETEPLPPDVLEAVKYRHVHVAYTEAAVAWAYGLRWRPLPTLQSYQGYTHGLDHLDADFLASARRPDRILMQSPPRLDNRLSQYDEPLVTKSLLCTYRTAVTTPQWQVLVPAVNRCGAERLIETHRVHWGQPVHIPPANNRYVLLRIRGAGISGLESIRGLAFKPYERMIRFDNHRFRLQIGTAGDGLVVAAPARADWPAPFSVAPGAQTVAVDRESRPTDGWVELEFASLPLR
jgi:hypothetical protein